MTPTAADAPELGAIRVGRDAALTLAANVFGGLAVVATLGIWARSLSTADFGALALVLATSAIARPILDLGLNNAIVRAVARSLSGGEGRLAGELVRTATVARATVSAGAIVLAVPLGRLIASLFGSDAVAPAFSAGIVLGVLLSVRQHVESLLRSERRYVRIAEANVARFGIPLVVTAVLAVAGPRDLAYAVGVFALAPLAFVLLAAPAIVSSHVQAAPASRSAARMLLSVAGWLAIVQLLDVAIQLDVPIVGYYLGATDVAYYYAAYRFLDLFTTVGAAAGFVLLPYASGAAADRVAFARLPGRVLVRLALLAVPAAITGWVYAPELVGAVWGPAFSPAAGVVRILMPGAAAALLTVGTGEILIARGDARLTVPLGILNFVANVTLLLALVPRLGIQGAALATTLSYVLVFAFAWLTVHVRQGVRGAPAGLLRVAVAGAAMLAAFAAIRGAMPVSPVEVVAAIVAGAAAYGLAVGALFPETALRTILRLRGTDPHPGTVPRPSPAKVRSSPRWTVCLTGDVHNDSPWSLDQTALAGESEVQHAIEYVRIAGGYGVRSTLFVSGRVAAEREDELRTLVAMGDVVEIGAHENDPFATEAIRLAWHRFAGAFGPAWLQRREIRLAVAALERAGTSPRSWSSHAYRQDANTLRLLRMHGFTHVSNVIDAQAAGACADSGLVVATVNTSPDHENVVHPGRRPPAVRPGALDPDQWLRLILQEIDRVAARGGVAVLRVHPTCQRSIDSFATFRRLCAALSEERTLFVRDLVPARMLVDR